jgi:hypothetical protein
MIVGKGSRDEVLRQFAQLSRSLRNQYFLMEGAIIYKHLEIENLARREGLLDSDGN